MWNNGTKRDFVHCDPTRVTQSNYFIQPTSLAVGLRRPVSLALVEKEPAVRRFRLRLAAPAEVVAVAAAATSEELVVAHARYSAQLVVPVPGAVAADLPHWIGAQPAVELVAAGCCSLEVAPGVPVASEEGELESALVTSLCSVLELAPAEQVVEVESGLLVGGGSASELVQWPVETRPGPVAVAGFAVQLAPAVKFLTATVAAGVVARRKLE